MRPWLIIMRLKEEAHKRHDEPQSDYTVFQLRFKQCTEWKTELVLLKPAWAVTKFCYCLYLYLTLAMYVCVIYYSL